MFRLCSDGDQQSPLLDGYLEMYREDDTTEFDFRVVLGKPLCEVHAIKQEPSELEWSVASIDIEKSGSGDVAAIAVKDDEELMSSKKHNWKEPDNNDAATVTYEEEMEVNRMLGTVDTEVTRTERVAVKSTAPNKAEDHMKNRESNDELLVCFVHGAVQ
jgi:hypothetical protein